MHIKDIFKIKVRGKLKSQATLIKPGPVLIKEDLNKHQKLISETYGNDRTRQKTCAEAKTK